MSNFVPVSLQAHQEPANLQVTNCGPARAIEVKVMQAANSVKNARVLDVRANDHKRLQVLLAFDIQPQQHNCHYHNLTK